jgi:hypothetical protein
MLVYLFVCGLISVVFFFYIYFSCSVCVSDARGQEPLEAHVRVKEREKKKKRPTGYSFLAELS